MGDRDRYKLPRTRRWFSETRTVDGKGTAALFRQFPSQPLLCLCQLTADTRAQANHCMQIIAKLPTAPTAWP